MKRQTSKREKSESQPKAGPDQTLHIKWPWSMTWMESVDEMLAFLKQRIE